MIAIPPYFLLVPYGIFMLGFLFFAFANVISLAKYGAKNSIGLTATFLFVAGTLVILFLTWRSLASVPWTEPVPIFQAEKIGF